MFDFIVAFIIGLIPLILGIIKKKIKLGVIGFVTCFIIWIIATPLFGAPVFVIFIWLIGKKSVRNDKYINKNNTDINFTNKFILIGIVISIVLTISAVFANAAGGLLIPQVVTNVVGGYAGFYIFIGTPIILLIIGSYVFFIMNKDNEKYQIRLNSGVMVCSAMVSFIACSALVLVFIHFQLINSMDGISFFMLSIFNLLFCLVVIGIMLLVTLGLKWFKKQK